MRIAHAPAAPEGGVHGEPALIRGVHGRVEVEVRRQAERAIGPHLGAVAELAAQPGGPLGARANGILADAVGALAGVGGAIEELKDVAEDGRVVAAVDLLDDQDDVAIRVCAAETSARENGPGSSARCCGGSK
jgi:hypothetical protein